MKLPHFKITIASSIKIDNFDFGISVSIQAILKPEKISSISVNNLLNK